MHRSGGLLTTLRQLSSSASTCSVRAGFASSLLSSPGIWLSSLPKVSNHNYTFSVQRPPSNLRYFFQNLLKRWLRYSCLDGGAWWAAVHGVARSWTQLSDFTLFFHFHALEKEMATHSSVLTWRIPGTGEPGGLPSMGSQSWTRLKHLAA